MASGRRGQAETAARRALDLLEAEAELDAADLADVADLLATLRTDTGDVAEAEALSRRALSLTDEVPAEDEALDRLRVHSLWGLAEVLRRRGCHHEAEDRLRAALTLAREAACVDDREMAVLEDELRALSRYIGRT